MSTVLRGSTRAASAVAALLLVILSLGIAGAAYAAPGGGNGNDGSSRNAKGADNGNDRVGVPGDARFAGGSSAARTGSSDKGAKGSAANGSSSQRTSAQGTSHATGKKAGDHGAAGSSGTSGNVTEPQPVSGADDNPGGANGQCPGGVYCSTRDGSPSGNGNGGGKATGKPCAGCVGKADNKNPKGQLPGPQDRNNGYECDGNNGIAKTNPAHTGCAPTPPCVDTPGHPCAPPPPCNPEVEDCVTEECPPGTAPAEDGSCVAGEEEVPTVLGEEAFRPRPNAQVLGAQAALPATGSTSGLGLLTGMGFTLLALGAGVMLRRRTA